MAKSEKYYHLKGTERPDELCPTCWLPSLLTYTLIRIDMTGVTTLGTRNACRGCKTWAQPLQPLKETSK